MAGSRQGRRTTQLAAQGGFERRSSEDESGPVGGARARASLDVTDPEPLPDGHPLWELPNCLITPHTADTIEMVLPLFAERIRTNVARFAAGEPLVGLVDPVAGY